MGKLWEFSENFLKKIIQHISVIDIAFVFVFVVVFVVVIVFGIGCNANYAHAGKKGIHHAARS